MSELKKPTKKELSDLFYKQENEGFYYYMTSYGPDWELLERCGFDVEEIASALKVLQKLEGFISNIEPEPEE